MLAEAVAAVLIPRMSELQAQDNRSEIIRLTMRATQKLAFFYFPIYVFLTVTAQTFITTLFTENYAESVPIFRINLILLPVYIWITDPIVRAYKELGKLLLIARVFILATLFGALYFGIQNFGLRGMIAIVVATAIVDRFVSSVLVFKKLNVSAGDLPHLKTIGKTAAASLIAGFFTYLFYRQCGEAISAFAANLARAVFAAPKQSLTDFISGVTVLAFSALLFVPVYLGAANFFGVVESEEKKKIKSLLFGRLTRRDLKNGNEKSASERDTLTADV